MMTNYTWAKKHQNMFIELNEELSNEVIKISSKYPKLIDPNKTNSDADPFIIALAKNRNWTVVTSENPSNNPDYPKIPDVCKNCKIKCIKPIEFIREKGWKY